MPTPEHGPGQDRDEEEDGGIAGAHGRPDGLGTPAKWLLNPYSLG